MKSYNQILGGRDYSLLETMHFGLRLPGTLSSFGNVDNISVSNWAPLKRGAALQFSKSTDRASHRSRIELFNERCNLNRSTKISEEELRGLSFYAFWRIFDVHKNTISKKKKERFIGLTGLGWPAHAKTTHPKHEEYARNTLIAYSPCPGNAGTEYIATMVQEHFDGDWRRALRAFVLDPTCKWCPTWVQRNYEVLNDVLCGFPHEHMPFPDFQAEAPNAGDASADAKNERFPHASKFSTKFVFKSGEPDDKAEEEADETQAHERAVRDRWTNEDRPAWEKHSELGPNLNAEGSSIRREILQEVVNPEDHAYADNVVPLRLAAWQTQWDKLADSKTRYTNESLTKDGMGDGYQKLFVNILLQHTRDLISAYERNNFDFVTPLRIFLLGTAGTGKTTTVQTTLQ